MKHIRDVNLDQYDLMEIWDIAYRMGYTDGYSACENEARCSPEHKSLPHFIHKLLEEEKEKN